MDEADVKTRIIAEIGTSHSGDLTQAKELIDAARESGADCVKSQIVYADEILHPDTGFVRLPGGDVRLYDRFRELEVPFVFFAELDSYCKSKGLGFILSPFGIRSARELKGIKPSFIKIASPELNHFPLLREVASYGVPLILSTGVSTLADIERALEATKGSPRRMLLHCVTSYPAPEEDYNLRVLGNLSAIFGVRVGVSDHSLDPVLVPALAVASGAVAIEKHITLSRSGSGLDDPVALPPELFAKMTRAIREAETLPADETIRALSAEFGPERVRKTLGTGVKALAPSERANYERTNRSLHYLHALSTGDRVTADDVAILRTEKVLTPGLSPEYLETIVGSTLARDVLSGAGVRWENFLRK
jgi:sialic acid synthase SpsE